MNKKEPTCTHPEWKTVKEVVRPERKDDKAPQFTGSTAYFIKKVCVSCGESRVTDYKVET